MVVAVATIAAVPLLVLENPNSFGSVTSTAGATETSLAATTAEIAAPEASESSGIVLSNLEEENSRTERHCRPSDQNCKARTSSCLDPTRPLSVN